MNWFKMAQSKELIIMRGLPGSGKSYLAKNLAGEKGKVFAADDYHIDPQTGQYNWKSENAQAAHNWNLERIQKAISQGVSPIVIDNTNVKMEHLKFLKPAIIDAQQQGYSIRIEEPNPNWFYWDTAFNPEALFERNKKTHNVPLETIQYMAQNYQPNITINDILSPD